MAPRVGFWQQNHALGCESSDFARPGSSSVERFQRGFDEGIQSVFQRSSQRQLESASDRTTIRFSVRGFRHSMISFMGAAAVRALTVRRIRYFGSPCLRHVALHTRQLSPGLAALDSNRRFVAARLHSADSWKSFNISRAIDKSSVNMNASIVTRAGLGLPPRADLSHLHSLQLGKGMAAGASRDLEAASTSDSSAHPGAEHDSRPKEAENKNSHGRRGVFAIGAGIFSTVVSYIIKLCGGGYTPYVKQAEKDIDKVADIVEEGARVVIKVADRIEEISHAADISAQQAEHLALKVEAKTKMVKETLDAIADVLEGDKKLSTVLTDYANRKKEATDTTQGP